MPDSFFDTNALLYLVGSDHAKAERAEALVAEGGAISVQVLNEFANVGRRKMQLAWPDLLAILDTLRDLLEVRGLTLDVHLSGLALAERHRLSVYDAMIVASALDAGSSILWSEDMHHGLVVSEQLSIRNPFRMQASSAV